MDVISMMHEINVATNSMIGESSLPDLLIAANDRPEFVGVVAFDQLDCAFDGYVVRRSQGQMSKLRHDDEGVQGVSAFAAIAIKSFQEETDIDFDREQLAAMKRRECHEISSRRRDESSRLQGKPSAAESRASSESLNWHECNSCPSRLFFVPHFSFWEERGAGGCVADPAKGEEV